MIDLAIFIASLFTFILSLAATLGSFFQKRWKWFFLMLALNLLSAFCSAAELYELLIFPRGHSPMVALPWPQPL